MPDYKKMTVDALRALARKLLGPGHSKKSKQALVAALEKGAAPAQATSTRARTSGSRTPIPAATPAKRGSAKPAPKATPAPKSTPAAKAATAPKAGAKAAAAKAAAKAPAKKPARVKEVPARVGAARKRKKAQAPTGPDPDGYFVARVRGEEAMRDAPHPMTEVGSDRWSAPEARAAIDEEHLGELPWGYGDDAFVALPRDPRTLFLYWDLSQETLKKGLEGLDRPRVQLWIFARGAADFERVRIIEFALESRGFYVHDLEPGRVYRAEIHAVDRAGRERRVAEPSNEVALPSVGPSAVVDDRFVRIPWELILGRLLGPGHAGAPFSEDARALLARLSDWSRFSGPTWGGSAGGMGGRPFSPTTAPSSPSSPFGGR